MHCAQMRLRARHKVRRDDAFRADDGAAIGAPSEGATGHGAAPVYTADRPGRVLEGCKRLFTVTLFALVAAPAQCICHLEVIQQAQ